VFARAAYARTCYRSDRTDEGHAGSEATAAPKFVLHGRSQPHGEGNVESVLDATAALAVYRSACRERGLPDPNVIGA